MNRQYDITMMKNINALIMESLMHSRKNYPVLSSYVKQHSQEMEEDVMRKHIDLYVNDFSVSLGSKGRAAVWQLLDIASHIIPPPVAGSFEIFI